MPIAEVPTLPVLVPGTIAAIAVVLLRLHRSGRWSGPRAAVGVVACVYGAGVLGHVLLPMRLDTHDPRPWEVWVHLTPLVDVPADPIGIVLNIALFVPLGVLLPLLVRTCSLRRILLTAFLLSLGIESVQLLGDLTVSPGRVFDVDDLIGNTFGALLGYAAFRVLALGRAPGDLAGDAVVAEALSTSASYPADRRG